MPTLTRSASATNLNRAYLTPHTPPSTHPGALVDVTPLPSLFNKLAEVAKRKKRSTSLQLKPATDELFSVPEGFEQSSPNLVKVYDVQQPSDAPTGVEVEFEPQSQPVIQRPPVTNDRMDYEDTSIVPPESANPDSPSAPIPPLTFGDSCFFPSNQTYTDHYPMPSIVPSLTSQEAPPSELNNPETFTYPTTYSNPPSTSTDSGPYFPSQEQAPFQPSQVNQVPQQIQVVEAGTSHPQCPMIPLFTHQTTLPVPNLSASAPVQNAMRPSFCPILTQSFPTTGTDPFFNRRRALNPSHHPSTLFSCAETHRHQALVPLAQQRQGLENPLVSWLQPRPRLPSWRIREIERQKEMDRIAEPYLVRLREISRQREAEAKAEAHAYSGQQMSEQGNSWWNFLKGEERKVRKGLEEASRQQRSDEKRQMRKNSRDERRRKSCGSAPHVGPEREVSASPRRSSAGRSEPYTIPRPAARSPRRLHMMPGGLDSEDLASCQQMDIASDVDALWRGFASVVGGGYRVQG